MIRFILRVSSALFLGLFIWAMVDGSMSFEDAIIPCAVLAGINLLCQKKKDKIEEPRQRRKTSVSQGGYKLGAFDSWLISKALGSGSSASSNISFSQPQSNYSGSMMNYRENANAEREARLQRERAGFARQADYWDREYERLIRQDPQCRNERTRVAEYNKNSFRKKSQGRW